MIESRHNKTSNPPVLNSHESQSGRDCEITRSACERRDRSNQGLGIAIVSDTVGSSCKLPVSATTKRVLIEANIDLPGTPDSMILKNTDKYSWSISYHKETYHSISTVLYPRTYEANTMVRCVWLLLREETNRASSRPPELRGWVRVRLVRWPGAPNKAINRQICTFKAQIVLRQTIRAQVLFLRLLYVPGG